MHPERPHRPNRSQEEVIAALYKEAGERLLAKQEALRQRGEWPHLSDIIGEEAADDYFYEQEKLYKAVWCEMAEQVRIRAEAIQPTEAADVEFLALYQMYQEFWLKGGSGWPPPEPSGLMGKDNDSE